MIWEKLCLNWAVPWLFAHIDLIAVSGMSVSWIWTISKLLLSLTLRLWKSCFYCIDSTKKEASSLLSEYQTKKPFFLALDWNCYYVCPGNNQPWSISPDSYSEASSILPLSPCGAVCSHQSLYWSHISLSSWAGRRWSTGYCCCSRYHGNRMNLYRFHHSSYDGLYRITIIHHLLIHHSTRP